MRGAAQVVHAVVVADHVLAYLSVSIWLVRLTSVRAYVCAASAHCVILRCSALRDSVYRAKLSVYAGFALGSTVCYSGGGGGGGYSTSIGMLIC